MSIYMHNRQVSPSVSSLPQTGVPIDKSLTVPANLREPSHYAFIVESFFKLLPSLSEKKVVSLQKKQN
jgi:hypothetical protein